MIYSRWFRKGYKRKGWLMNNIQNCRGYSTLSNLKTISMKNICSNIYSSCSRREKGKTNMKLLNILRLGISGSATVFQLLSRTTTINGSNRLYWPYPICWNTNPRRPSTWSPICSSFYVTMTLPWLYLSIQLLPLRYLLVSGSIGYLTYYQVC